VRYVRPTNVLPKSVFRYLDDNFASYEIRVKAITAKSSSVSFAYSYQIEFKFPDKGLAFVCTKEDLAMTLLSGLRNWKAKFNDEPSRDIH
jgi:hypothetical protein